MPWTIKSADLVGWLRTMGVRFFLEDIYSIQYPADAVNNRLLVLAGKLYTTPVFWE